VTTSVDVRVATEAELPAVVATLGQEQFFRDRWLRQELGNGELFVAWVGPTPVGDLYLWRELPEQPRVADQLGWTPTIQHLEVAVSWRKQGIGTALLDAAQRHAANLGYGRVCLGAGVTNHGARRLYQRLGYVDWGHGLVAVVWDEPGPDGATVRAGETCHWLVRSLPTDAPGPDDWASWHPEEVYRRLAGCTVDWHVAGRWAADLWLGREIREREDVVGARRRGPSRIAIAIDRTDFPAWRSPFAGFSLYDAGHGRARRLGPGDEPDPRHHQVRLCDPAVAMWRMDIFLEERPDGWWTCHWLPLVRHPMPLVVARTASGIPYLRPEFVLLAKAKHRRPKDEADLTELLPTLDSDARDRLRAGLIAADEAHPWLALVS
jgi:GNAT superfamily N-acetyltransferase